MSPSPCFTGTDVFSRPGMTRPGKRSHLMSWMGTKRLQTDLKEYSIGFNTKSFAIPVKGRTNEEYFAGHASTTTWKWKQRKRWLRPLTEIAQRGRLCYQFTILFQICWVQAGPGGAGTRKLPLTPMTPASAVVTSVWWRQRTGDKAQTWPTGRRAVVVQ